MLKIDFLINDFLLDRLPDADSRQKQDLINTSRQLLAKTVFLSGYRDRLVDSQMCFSWILVYAGIPSAGILAVELLKQSKQPNEYPFILPRSEVVQNLSIYIGCLEYVRPAEGNYKVCKRVRTVFKRMLDQTLDMPPTFAASNQLSSVPTQQPISEIDISTVLGPQDDARFTEWLDSIDWTNDPWIDFSQFTSYGSTAEWLK